MTGAIATFCIALVAFTAMHGAVLASFAWLARTRGGRPLGLAPDARGLRLAAEFVGTEAALLTIALRSGLLPLAAPSVRSVVLVPAASLLFWEVWFYAGHRAMHTRALYALHRPHHAVAGIHPSLSFGAGETALLSAGFYVPLALASHLAHAVSFATLVLTFSVAYVLNVASHLESNLLGAAHDTGPWRHVLNSARYHAQHHADPRGNYALVSPWLDRLCATEFTANAASRARPRAPRTRPQAPRGAA